MGVYIKGIETPKICGQCQIKLGIDCELWRHVRSVSLDRHKDCPLVPVPPHGRLIDAKYIRDAIIQKWMDKAGDSHMYKCGMEDAYEVIRNAPTVVQAEEGET